MLEFFGNIFITFLAISAVVVLATYLYLLIQLIELIQATKNKFHKWLFILLFVVGFSFLPALFMTIT